MENSWNLLLVEDDEDDYLLTKAQLAEVKQARHKLDWAPTYDAAIQKLSEIYYDCVLVDYDLGAQTGLDLIRAVNDISSHIPIILLTGRGTGDTDLEAMYAGAADYLMKSEVTSNLLERTIRYAIYRKHVEEELHKAKDDLEERVRAAVHERDMIFKDLVEAEKHMVLSRMIASVAHELNNPIQTIGNCLYLLKADLKPEVQDSEVMNMALSEANRIATIVNNLREIYRPSKIGPMQPVKVLDIIEDARKLLIPHLQHQQVIWVQSPCPTHPVIGAVADQIKQVFLNISMNAIEAMQPQGGKLEVVVRENLSTRMVGISFCDSGMGIPEENLAQVFEPFFTTKDKGTGLGLAICYDIIKRHNGTITVHNNPGGGAEFTVLLPLLNAEGSTEPKD